MAEPDTRVRLVDETHLVVVPSADIMRQFLNLARTAADRAVAALADIATALAGKLSLTGGAMTGPIAMGNQRITGLPTPNGADQPARLTEIGDVLTTIDNLGAAIYGNAANPDINSFTDVTVTLLNDKNFGANVYTALAELQGATGVVSAWKVRDVLRQQGKLDEVIAALSADPLSVQRVRWDGSAPINPANTSDPMYALIASAAGYNSGQMASLFATARTVV